MIKSQSRRKVLLVAVGLPLLVVLASTAAWFYRLDERWTLVLASWRASDRIPMAVLGDSDSHSYHDWVSFGSQPSLRGGAYRSTTWQWPEVLVGVRGDVLDLGPWSRWGTNVDLVALLRQWRGQEGRMPLKEDYRYNMAVSGAHCEQLMTMPYAQAVHLRRIMDEAPQSWEKGVVVIRIGVNDFGQPEDLEPLAQNPSDPVMLARMDSCVNNIQSAVSYIHAHHPKVAFLVVGIFNNAHWAVALDRWRSAQAQRNLNQGLDHFDSVLKAWADRDPRVAFFSDRDWFKKWMGGRNGDGLPAYHDAQIGTHFKVHNTAGDAPMNAFLADGHAGSVLNAMWTRSIIEHLNAEFATAISVPTDDELIKFLDPDGKLGMR